MSATVRLVFLISAWLMAAQGYAQDQVPAGEANPTAHEIVRDASERVMQVVEAAQDYVDEDPQRYFEAVHEVLDPVIDYRGFARSVMGPYASKDRYMSLDEAGRAELRAQLERFTDVMRKGLVRTYGKGLLAFGGSRIEISSPSDADLAKRQVSVRQLIYSDEAQPYVLMYQMGQGKDGSWQLRNVIIETINLGEIYRNQFQAGARKHDGDLSAVIDNWSSSDIDS